MDINQFIQEVHQNAVEHGWWDGERTISELVALIHSEWSEALEEFRAGHPMVWYACEEGPEPHHPCESEDEFNCTMHSKEDRCKWRGKKPEGIAVELIDGCIRIFDLVGFYKADLSHVDFDAYVSECSERLGANPLPHVIATAHWKTSEAFALFMGFNTDFKPEEGFSELVVLCLSICGWVKHQGIDPVKLLIEKHEYNKTRPYKHGGKVI